MTKTKREAIIHALSRSYRYRNFAAVTTDIEFELTEAGYAIVPVEPTPKQFEAVGTMDGWEGDWGKADENHADWWKAMIATAQEAGG